MKDSVFEKGQALVLVLLSLAVVLTLVLYILSRSVTDILVTSKTEETSRAFSAAEAGIEQALVIGSGTTNPGLGNNAGYTSSVSGYSEGSHDFNSPFSLDSGDAFTVWFVSHDNSGHLTCAGKPCFTGNAIQVCWGKPHTLTTTPTTPAVELTVFYEVTPGVLSSLSLARKTLDPYTSRTNSFDDPDPGNCTIAGVGYEFQKTINFSDLGVPAASYDNAGGLQFMRIRMLYNTDAQHPVGVTTPGTSTLPSQGQSIVSTGYTCAGSTPCALGNAQQTVRRIDVFQGWPEIPAVLDNAIFGSTGITK